MAIIIMICFLCFSMFFHPGNPNPGKPSQPQRSHGYEKLRVHYTWSRGICARCQQNKKQICVGNLPLTSPSPNGTPQHAKSQVSINSAFLILCRDVSDIIPRVAVEGLLETLLVQVVANKADGATQDKETI